MVLGREEFGFLDYKFIKDLSRDFDQQEKKQYNEWTVFVENGYGGYS